MLNESDLSEEHIIPLALGGSNQFTIPVSAEFNCKLGGEIDGALANDFLMLGQRIKHEAKGHSGKLPKALVKRAYLGESQKPVQIEFYAKSGLEMFDPIARKALSPEEFFGRQFQFQIILRQYTRYNFAAKVALSAGYFVYGDWFVNNVAHDEIRKLMMVSSKSRSEEFDGMSLRVYDELSKVSEADKNQRGVEEHFCRHASGSSVMFVRGEDRLFITVGVLGQYLASINVEADMASYPNNRCFDLGHAIVIKNGVMDRMSYREYAERVLKSLEDDQ